MNFLRILVASLVAVVWAVVYLASVLNPAVSAPPELSGVMLAVVTWLFGREFRDRFQEQRKKLAAVIAGEDESKPPEAP